MQLQYEIGVVGERSVERALAGIERRIAQHNARVARATGTRSGPQAPGDAMASFRRQATTASRIRVSEAEKTARKVAAAEERAALQTQRYWERAHRHSQDFRIRQGERVARQEQRALERQAKAAMRNRERFARGTFGFAGNSVRGTLAAVGAGGGAALGLAGGFAAAGAIRAQMDERAAASRLANQAGDPSLKGALLQESQGVRGFTGSEALKGMEEFVTKTGDLSTARAIIGDLGSLALATGSDLGDLGATAGQAFNVLKDQISDPVERVRELNALMRTLAQQGSLGAVEIRDLASDFGKLGAATRSFEGGAPELLRTMGAFAQIAVMRGGASSSADASTAAARLAGDMVEPAKRKRFRALGVDLKSENDPTKLRDPLSIMLDVLERTGGDVEKTSGLFGIESAKIFKGLGATFSEAEKRKAGSGRQAVTEEFNRFAGARLTDQDVKARADSRFEDPDLKIKETLKQFNARVGEQLLPAVLRITESLGRLLPYAERLAVVFADLVQSFVDDPLSGIGKLIAAKLVADIAAAGLSNVLKSAVTSAFTGGTGGAATGGKPIVGGATAGAMLGAAGTGAQLGIAAATVILTAGVVNFEKSEADIKSAGQLLNEARDAAARGDTETVRQKQREVQDMMDKRNRMTSTEGFISGALDVAQFTGVPGLITKAAGVDTDQAARAITGATIDQSRETEVRSYQTMIEEMDKLQSAASKASGALAKLDASNLNRGNSPTKPPVP